MRHLSSHLVCSEPSAPVSPQRHDCAALEPRRLTVRDWRGTKYASGHASLGLYLSPTAPPPLPQAVLRRSERWVELLQLEQQLLSSIAAKLPSL